MRILGTIILKHLTGTVLFNPVADALRSTVSPKAIGHDALGKQILNIGNSP